MMFPSPAPAHSEIEAKPDAAAIDAALGPRPPERTTEKNTAPADDPATASPIDPRTLTGPIEAVLLSADRPVSALKLAAALGLIPDVTDDEAGAATAEPSDPPKEPAPTESPAAAGGVGEGGGEDQGTPAATPKPPQARKPRRKKPDALLALRARAVEAIKAAVVILNEAYEQTGRAFRVESLAGGYRVMTLPAHSGAIAAYRGARAKTSLSPAALEALAIIAYKQPMTRAKLEAIRGVACGEILRTLLDRKLITITGRAEELGRPLLYGTSKRFLELFGLSTLKDLPSVDELKNKG